MTTTEAIEQLHTAIRAAIEYVHGHVAIQPHVADALVTATLYELQRPEMAEALRTIAGQARSAE
jgi:hypothetical protein